MQDPVLSRPLCFCDPQTTRAEDFVSVQMDGQIPGGQRFLGIKYHPRQTWYYYPEMTTDEVLVFKQCHFEKGQETHGRMPVCHTSFVHPDTARRTEPRCSFEYRVSYLI